MNDESSKAVKNLHFYSVIRNFVNSARRECLDHVIVFGEGHLRRILKSYAEYYNCVRTHLSLDKDAPIYRPVDSTGPIVAMPIVGGLHHHYVRI